MKIGQNTFVSLSYTLTVGGEVADQASAEAPLEFAYGVGSLLPKFEEHITGLVAGDKYEFTLTPEDGYGVTIEDAIVELPQDVFMIDGAVEEGLLVVGNQIPMSTQDGQRMVGIIKSVGDTTVTMDFNHPMAGKTLNFNGEIVAVREATEEDMMPTGCGCNSEGCGDCDSEGCDSEDGKCGCGC